MQVMFNLGFFSLEGNPSLYMRELYCVYVDLLMRVITLREGLKADYEKYIDQP